MLSCLLQAEIEVVENRLEGGPEISVESLENRYPALKVCITLRNYYSCNIIVY